MLPTLQNHASLTGPAFRPQAARSQDSAGSVNVLPGAPAQAVTGRVELITDPTEIQPALMEAIHEAKTSIKADFHMLKGPQGQEIARQLARRARQGLRVQLLAWGEATPAFMDAVRTARSHGLTVRVGQPTGGQNRNPVAKFLIADDRLALIGSLAAPSAPGMIRKGLLRVSGEAACEVSRQFNHDWAEAGGTPMQLLDLGVFGRQGGHDLLSQIQVGGAGSHRKSARAMVLSGLNRARFSIEVLGDQVDDAAVVEALIKAQQRGVSVKVLVSGEDNAPGGLRGWLTDGRAAAIAKLLKAGVPVRRFHANGAPEAVELRYAFVDGDSLLFGSQPWSRDGLAASGEVMLDVRGGRELGVIRAGFLRDWSESFPAEPPSGIQRAVARALPLMTALNRVARRYSPAASWQVVMGLHVGLVKYPGRGWTLVADIR